MWTIFILSKPKTRKRSLGSLLLLSSIVTGGVAIASGLNADKHTISLREAVVKTIQHNPDLRAFDYRLQAQRGRVQQAKLAPSPELSLGLEDILGTGDHRGMDSAQATLSISWVLEHGVRQRFVDTAHAGSSLIQVEADIKRLESAAETAFLFLDSLAYQEREAVSDKTVQLAEESVKSVSKRVKAGKAPAAELFRAQAELARRRLQLEDIGHERLSANRQLAAQWGETKLTFGRVEGDIKALPELPSFEALKSQLAQNPEFARLLSDRRLKEAELQLALAHNKPSWRINAGIRHNNSSNDQSFVTGITIPFGERSRNPGRIATARANLEKIDSDERAMRVRLETLLFLIHEKLQHNLHVIETLQGAVIPPLEQAAAATRRAYNLGRYSYLELRSVQIELLQARESLVEASIHARRNIIEIERLTGVRVAQPTDLSNQPKPRDSK